MPKTVDVRRSADRPCTAWDGVRTWHSLSAARHYDPGSTSFGLLVLHDEHVLAPGQGFPLHRHRDVEVVTWVLEGTLTHEDSTGARGELRPGQVQVLSAGAGVAHAERNDAAQGGKPLRLVQAWVVPDRTGGPARHEQRDAGPQLAAGDLVAVASGDGAGLPLRARGATLHVARLPAGQSVPLPYAPYAHVFVAAGVAELEGAGPLAAGDAARCTGGGRRTLTATDAAEVLVWELHGDLRP